MEAERLNSPHTSAVLFEALGHQLQFSQDPNSKHHGTTVWDASMVFVKFLEKNCRKGRFSQSKLKGKRVIELGAGCGVAGFGMALLGCDVISTDQTEVLPLLMRNVDRNTSRITQMAAHGSDSFGSIEVAELSWGNTDHIRAVGPPFDYIIGTDVVYSEHLLEPLLQTILQLSGPRTVIILGYELRSTNVHDQMIDLWKKNFEVKSIPRSKMHNEYQHPSIQLFMMTPKSSDNVGIESDIQIEDEKFGDTKRAGDEDDGSGGDVAGDKIGEDDGSSNKIVGNVEGETLSDWETRRCGALAARLLRDVKIS